MSARTHPEKKWVAGTNESKDRTNHLAAKSRLTGWVWEDATLGGNKNLQVKGGEQRQCIGRIVSTTPCIGTKNEANVTNAAMVPQRNYSIYSVVESVNVDT